jgi:Zn-dependent peptidase ImmA (M78 family)
MINNYHLQKAASNFRNQNGIAPCEPIRLRSWLSRLEVFTMFRPMSDGFCGMAHKQDDHRFIIVNSRHALGKQHFTIAHELYHLFIQEDFTSMVCHTGSFNKKNKIEYEADWFAAYLLLPEECVLALIPEEELSKNKITLATIVKIEQYFACSRRALLIRLDSMDLITYSKYEEYASNVSFSARMLGYDDALYKPGNENLVIGDYGMKANKLLKSGKISESHFISLMQDIGVDIENLPKENEQIVQ